MSRASQNGKRSASQARPKVRHASRAESSVADPAPEPVLPPRQWQNRIVGHGEEAAEQLLANPRNWRIHPKRQQDAIAGVLSKIGWVQDVIVNQRTGFVVDGHARVALAISAGERVPVVYVDLSEEEEAAVLATFDPLGAMAGKDDEIFKDLVAGMDEAYAALAGGVQAVDPTGFPTLPIGDKSPFQEMTFTLHDSQAEQVKAALESAGRLGPYTDSPNENSNGNALARVCETFLTTHANR